MCLFALHSIREHWTDLFRLLFGSIREFDAIKRLARYRKQQNAHKQDQRQNASPGWLMSASIKARCASNDCSLSDQRLHSIAFFSLLDSKYGLPHISTDFPIFRSLDWVIKYIYSSSWIRFLLGNGQEIAPHQHWIWDLTSLYFDLIWRIFMIIFCIILNLVRNELFIWTQRENWLDQ